ncbi:ankyrin repeat and sam domain containing protein 6 [Colletotrichum musicola]|uniref:Ankyrin repeat and sam domain containing protein 6 n=1 Tax=Colletotrichum musicola TaxID=2175873 RepID=A0A8H6N040_9PEZI|nr:ankyrin repeat and sam domain containing protein 6 [Colletotrichum musicola]
MKLLLDRRGEEVKVIEEVVKAAAGNASSGEKVMALLLNRRGEEVKVIEEVTVCQSSQWKRHIGISECIEMSKDKMSE